MRQDVEALHQLARIAIQGFADEDTLTRAASIIRRATGVAEAMVVYAENADFLVSTDAGNGAAIEFTQTALWIVQRQIMELGGPVAFNLIGHRVEDFTTACNDEEREFLALSMPTSEGASEMCILREIQEHKGRATILRFMESATPSLTIILERFLTASRSRRYGEKLSALANAAQLLAQSDDLQTALANLATAIAGSTATDYVSIDVYDADSGRFVLRALNQSRFAGLSVTQAWIDSLDPDRPDPRNLEVMRSRQPYLSPDVQNDEREPEAVRRYFEATLIRSVATFPVLFQDEFLGTVAFVYYAPHTFPPEEISFLQGFVAQAATALKALQMHNELQRHAQELRRSADEYIATTNLTGDIIARLDKHGNWTFLNDAACQFYGKPREELLGTDSTALLHPEDIEVTAQIIRETRARKAPAKGFVNRQLTPTGTRVVEWNGYPLFDDKGQYAGVQITGRDISERRQMEDALRQSEERYRLIAENTSDLIWIVDLGLNYTYMSPAITRMRGYTAEEIMGASIAETMTPASLEAARKTLAEELAMERMENKDTSRSRKLELEMYCKDGSTIWTEMNMKFLRDADGNPIAIQGVTRDISERKRMEEERERLHAELELRAITDGLTGLYNHAHFYQRLTEELERSKRYKRRFAVLMMDVDNFKYYNDSRGHQAGDDALRLLADCIRTGTRRSDLSFRYGGDEFAAILLNAASPRAQQIANRINKRVSARLKEMDDPAAGWLDLSTGIACFPDDGATADELVKAADTALYDAKRVARPCDAMQWEQAIDPLTTPTEAPDEKQPAVLSAATTPRQR
ncbi:MAG: diguanylate cyclase [Dehalococcoidia bacterium]|nr:MAG: diguanylate cyclase [Dehalococcoidia bacterium]